jgi:XapX domain-containing protein
MKLYFLSLEAGLLVGIIYALLGVRSPAPPAIALLGLLGMLVGEQAIPLAKELVQRHALARAARPSAQPPTPLVEGEAQNDRDRQC